MARRSSRVSYIGYNNITIVELAVSESAMISSGALCVSMDMCVYAPN